MRVFFDTEFMEDGEQIRPLSIGMTTEATPDKADLYLVVTDTDRSLANPWVQENVIPHLDDYAGPAWYVRCPAAEAGAEILRWFRVVQSATLPIEFWADYGAYDWVMLCQLFGTMMDLPEGWPMFVHDIQQLAHACRMDLTDSTIREGGQEHNALHDALECKARYRHLMGVNR